MDLTPAWGRGCCSRLPLRIDELSDRSGDGNAGGLRRRPLGSAVHDQRRHPADFTRITAGIERCGQLVPHVDGQGVGPRGARPAALAEGRRRRPGSTLPGPRSTTTSPSSSSSPTRPRCAPPTSGRLPASPTRCRTSTRRAAGSRSPSRGAAGGGGAHAVRAGPHPVVLMPLPASTPPRRSSLDPAEPPRPRDGHGHPRRARPGRAEYDLPTRRLGAGGRGGLGGIGTPDLDRTRLAVSGVSLGGYYAPRVAAASATG